MTPFDRSLNSLDPAFRPLGIELLARLVEANIPVLIVNTRRTAEQQAEALRMGRSWVQRSKHQDGLAIDIAPYDSYQLYGADKLRWDSNDPVWERIGVIGEALGLRWGGRWKVRDMGHFELVKVNV